MKRAAVSDRSRTGSVAVSVDVSRVGDVAVSMMAGRGATYPFRTARFAIDESVVLPATHGSLKPVPPALQLRWLAQCLEKPTEPWWLVIGSVHDEDAAVAAAAGVMLRAVQRSMAEPGGEPLPFMWPLYGGYKDRLRDDHDFRDSLGAVGVLVLTNLDENSTRDKLEKARDLLYMYRGHSRVLVVSGSDPLRFARDRLHMTPSRVLHLGRGARNRIWQV